MFSLPSARNSMIGEGLCLGCTVPPSADQVLGANLNCSESRLGIRLPGHRCTAGFRCGQSASGPKQTSRRPEGMSALPPQSGHRTMRQASPLCSRKRHMQCSKTALLFDHVVARCWRNPAYAASIARNEIRVPATSHGRTPSDRSVGAQLMNSTLVPLWIIFANACASQLVRWTQPCDWVLPMLSGFGVPWMP